MVAEVFFAAVAEPNSEGLRDLVFLLRGEGFIEL